MSRSSLRHQLSFFSIGKQPPQSLQRLRGAIAGVISVLVLLLIEISIWTLRPRPPTLASRHVTLQKFCDEINMRPLPDKKQADQLLHTPTNLPDNYAQFFLQSSPTTCSVDKNSMSERGDHASARFTLTFSDKSTRVLHVSFINENTGDWKIERISYAD